jgi:hypothetical protein
VIEMAGAQAVESVAPKNPVVAYVVSLWRGELPLARVFWSDMLIIGTVANVAAMISAVLLFVSGLPIAVGVTAHFSPVPYNLLLLLGVWHAAQREASRWSFAAQTIAVVWFIAMLVI